MKNIYILSGENVAGIEDYQESIVKKYLKDGLNEFSYVKINMLENSIEELIYECGSSGFFSDKKIVVAENCTFLTAKPKKTKVNYNLEKLQSYIDKNYGDTILILKCLEQIDNRKKIVKSVKKYGELVIINNFKTNELVNYIIDNLSKENINISREVANFLIVYSNLDLLGIKKELEKLILLEKEEILKEDIENIVTRSLEYDIFSLTNELFLKNYEKFRSIYEVLKINGEEPIYLLTLVANQLRLYYKVKILIEQNYSQKDIANKLNTHPYRIQLAVNTVYSLNLFQIYKAVLLCKEADEQLKTSNINKYINLDIFFNKLIEILN